MRRALALGLSIALGLGALSAGAQAPKGSSSAKAPPAPTSSAKAPPTASPSGSARALPPGHPSVDEVPPGHPQLDPDQEDPDGDGEEQQAPNPHARMPGMYEPPPDVSQDDPSLPPGTIVVTVADAKDAPVPGAPLQLGILHNSVAKGESRERVAREADAAGSVRFDGLEVGSGVTYRVSTTRDAATYAVMPFALGDKAGKRVVVHAYDVASNIEDVLVGTQGMVYLSLREDAMSIEHLFNMFNIGPVSWVPANVEIRLPEGFKAFNKPEQMADTRFNEVSGKGAALRGTFSPGRHDTTFKYQVPLAGTERQTFRIEMPPHVAQIRVMAEASKSMGLEVSGFPPAQKNTNRDGKRILVTDRQVSRNEGGIRTLEITITGLPVPSPTRWIAVALGLLAIAGGAAYAFQEQQAKGGLHDDTRSDLLEAQRALLDEIVLLERAKNAGDVGPKTYARVRAALLDALARIASQLEAEPPPQRRA